MADLTGIWLMTTGGDNTPYRAAEDDTPYVRGSRRNSVQGESLMLDPSIRRLCFGVDMRETDWMVDGHCANAMHDEWFHVDEDGPNTASLITAKRICGTCPVREQCLDYGIRHDEWGIWGGLSQRARRRLRAQSQEAAS